MRVPINWRGIFGRAPVERMNAPAARHKFAMDIPVEMLEAMSGGGLIAPRISRELALQVPAVMRCRNIIAGSLGTLPIRVHDSANRVATGPFLVPKPDPQIPQSVMIAETVEDLFFEGIAWWRVTKFGPSVGGRRGFPLEAYRVPVGRVYVAPTNAPTPQLVSPDLLYPVDGRVYVDGIPVPDREMIRFDSPNPPFLRHAARAIRTCLLLDSAAALYAKEPMPLGYFAPRDPNADPATPEEITEVLDDWETARAQRVWGFVNAALEAKTLSWNPEQLQLAAQRQHAVLEIARAAGVDPEELGVSTTSRTYANQEQRGQALITFTLGAYVSALQDRLSMGDVLPPDFTAQIDFSGFLRGDEKTRMETYKVGLEVGAYADADEVRVSERKPKLTAAQRAARTPAPTPTPSANGAQAVAESIPTEKFVHSDLRGELALESERRSALEVQLAELRGVVMGRARFHGDHDQSDHGNRDGGGSDDGDDETSGLSEDDNPYGDGGNVSEYDVDAETGEPRFSSAYREKYGSVQSESQLSTAEGRDTTLVESERGAFVHMADDTNGTKDREVIQEFSKREAGELGDGIMDVYGGDKASVSTSSGVTVRPASDNPTRDGVVVTWASGREDTYEGEAGNDFAFDLQQSLSILGGTMDKRLSRRRASTYVRNRRRDRELERASFTAGETMKIRFDAADTHDFQVDAARRTVVGVLLPWGKVANNGMGKWRFTEGSVSWSEVSRVKLNLHHDNHDLIGVATRLQSASRGLVGTFRVGRGPEGDRALEQAEDGILDGFSVEVEFDAGSYEMDSEDDSVRLVHHATLRGVALTGTPAFDDARLTSVTAERTPSTDGNTTMGDNARTATVAGAAAGATPPDLNAFMTDLATKMAESHKAATEGLAESLGTSLETGVKAALENLSMPQADGPQPVRAARWAVTHEPPVYAFAGVGHSMVRDAYHAVHQNDREALARLRKYHEQTDEMAKLAIAQLQMQNFAPQSTATAPQIIPPGYRPDLYVSELLRGRPLVDACSRGSIDNASPFTVPVFTSSTGVTADHVEGTNPADGSIAFATKTVTPGGISGRLVLTREIVDSSNPAIDQIALATMRESYARQTEAKVYTLLNGANGAGGVITGDFVPSGAQASTVATASLPAHIRGRLAKYPFNRFAAPGIALMGQNATTILATAVGTDGRPLFPSVGATNPSGLGNAITQGWFVDGLAFVPAWAMTGTAAGDSQIMMLNQADAWVWESPLLTFQFNEKLGPANIELNVFGYFGTHLLRPVGLSGIRIT